MLANLCGVSIQLRAFQTCRSDTAIRYGWMDGRTRLQLQVNGNKVCSVIMQMLSMQQRLQMLPSWYKKERTQVLAKQHKGLRSAQTA